MKRTFTLIRLLIVTSLLSVAFSFAALAVTINAVSFIAYLEDDTIESDIQDPDFRISDDADRGYYELYYVNRRGETENYGLRTYDLEFHATDGNRFNRTASYITVTGQRIESITRRTVSDDGRVLTVRLRAYPYVKLEETSSSADSSLPGTGERSITLEKPTSVSRVEYYIVYRDYNGTIRTVHNSTTSRTISVSSYTRARRDEDEDDRAIVGFWCRSRTASNSSNPYIAPSDWTGQGEEPDGDITNYTRWSEYLGESSTSYQDSSAGTVTNPGSGITSVSGSWVQSGNNWYYRNSNGSLATGWIQVDGYWYYLDQTNGRMLTGWFNDTDGHRYYLNPYTGGPQGSMVTGWFQDSTGNWYYLNPNTGGPRGSVTTGWILDGGLWYYCSAATGGTMLTGWFTDSDGQRYYLNPYTGGPKGSMLTGWHMLDGRWYFFRQSTAAGQGSMGAAIVNRQVSINGIIYTFDANGAMVETL